MLHVSLKNALLRSTILVGAAAFSVPSMAQVNQTPPAAGNAGQTTVDSAGPAEAATDQEITVTGTLIRNPNLLSSAPINVTTSEEVALRQSNVAEEVLRQIPGVVSNIGSAVNNGNGGASFVDLRGLGPNRNIVLLDGNRITPADATGSVDLNNIPLALIQRTEVLTGGASTTYGADAISGVVNFITRSDFAGVEATGSEQLTERGDANFYRTDVSIGANFDDGKGNAVLSIGYQHADPLTQGDRKYSNTQYSSTSGAASGSDVTVPSEIILGGEQTQIDPATGTLGPIFQKFNFNPYNVFQTPFRRYNIFAAAHYDMADGITAYTRALFSKNTVKTIVAPSGIFDEILSVPVSNPYLPVNARNQLCADQGISIGACDAAAGALTTDDPNYRTLDLEVLRRTPELGPRISSFQTTVFDYRLGVRGDITDHIQFDVNGSYGESENIQTISGYTLTSRVRQASLATNTTTCLDTTNDCVPINLFGAAGSITPAQAAFLTANSTSTNRSTLAQARAVISGDFGVTSPFSSDAVGFAVGGEYRRYTASQASDLLSQTPGELGGSGGSSPSFNGAYEVKEGFGELIAPLVQGRPFFENLTVEAGVRYSDYKIDAPGNPGYNTTTYKGGGSWEPAKGIKFRGNYQHAVRAPNIFELFNPVTVGLTNLTTEPCVGPAPLADPNLAAVCLAQGAPANTIGNIQVPNSGQANNSAGGNVNLKPETSNSFTAGAVFQPPFVPGLSISVDYYNIKINNAVSTPTPDDVINACFGNITAASATSDACTSIRRNPGTGQLSGSPATTFGLPQPLSNLGRLKTDGIDLVADYSRDIGFAKLGLNFAGNYTRHSKFQATPTSVFRECVGYYSVNCGAAGSSPAGSIQPKYSWNQRSTLSFDKIDLSLLWRHISKERFEPGQGTRFSGTLAGGDLNGKTVNFNKIPAYDYFDLAARVAATDVVTFTFTVNNLTDKQPPILGNTIGSTFYNSGNTYPSTYDTLGRSYRVSATVKF